MNCLHSHVVAVFLIMTVRLLDYEGFKDYDKDNWPWKSLKWLEAFMFVCLENTYIPAAVNRVLGPALR
jgi:hypothetical protein